MALSHVLARRVPLLGVLVVGAALLGAACGGNENSNAAFRPTYTPAASGTPTARATADGLPGSEFPSNGNEHVAVGQRHGSYFSNPPTSGWHLAELPPPGIYNTDLAAEDIPHFLEHGGVWLLYKCPENNCPDVVGKLAPIVNQATQRGRPVALAPYSLMDRKIAAVAWQRGMALEQPDDARLNGFIDAFVCKYNPEGGPYCPTTAGRQTQARDAGSGGFSGQAPTPTPVAKRYEAAPPMTIDTAKTYIATIVTDKGEIKVELNAKAAPETVNSFVFLARDGFYDSLTFHRVEPGFVIQGGDPLGNGTGGPGYTIKDEKSGLKHDEGVIAMAKSAAPNSAGSQFYITLAPQPSLDANYTVFGKVTSGLDVVKRITKGDRMTKVTIEER